MFLCDHSNQQKPKSVRMIFGFTITSKRGKGDLCKKKIVGFTLMVTRGTKHSPTSTQTEQSPHVICRSEYVKSFGVENATVVQFFKPEEAPTQLNTTHHSLEEGHSEIVEEKASEN
jgi:hypothetical protein